MNDVHLLTKGKGVEVWRRWPKRILRTRRRPKKPRTPRPRWRDLAWWPSFELRVRHGWSAPRAGAWAVARAPGPVASTRTLFRFAARLFTEWIRSKGIELTDAQIAWVRRRHLISFWYDCACQDKGRCPGLPPQDTRRYDKRAAGGQFEVGQNRKMAGACAGDPLWSVPIFTRRPCEIVPNKTIKDLPKALLQELLRD